MTRPVSRLLTISGSLRAGSSNTALLDAAARLVPAGVTASAYTGLALLPAFSPDLEEDTTAIPPSVAHWRTTLATAHMILLSSPEYAHGIPGALKNALDWVVGSGEFMGKPVGLLSASTASHFVHPQLLEVLKTMDAMVVSEASVVLDLPRRGVDAAQLAADPVLAPALRAVVHALLSASRSEPGS